MRDRPSTTCLAYIAGEPGTPIRQSCILLSATQSAGPAGACLRGLSGSDLVVVINMVERVPVLRLQVEASLGALGGTSEGAPVIVGEGTLVKWLY